ncbi:4a-hydroxytetrahydrobiopterin dehydratase [Sphingomonas sp. PAMC 26617]|uniref:4a-hydroxytetrahydrobiopterin dehydratase n=1 Tax=Sphingomonas sp. PAMC 26617 TaxID=1112216 RepID=UPI001E554D53|nr:4a-hydroxytetrahydrobiopterin dehydratase [Sphingomonas sp. PAMC 26617]
MDNRDMIVALTPAERDDALKSLSGWSFDEARGALFRRIEFSDFSEAFGTMTRIAIEAERRDHHPEWSNVYNQLEIWLTTHDAGNAVSALDVELAAKISTFIM